MRTSLFNSQYGLVLVHCPLSLLRIVILMFPVHSTHFYNVLCVHVCYVVKFSPSL